MGKRILVIVASGKSSRFGGFPKALCKIGKVTNAENTYEKAKSFYDKIYLAVNSAVYKQFNGEIQGCQMFSIVTGQGDAHSLLKCIEYIKKCEKDVERISACWGDAVFINSHTFEEFEKKATRHKVSVACAEDQSPYAWFDIDDSLNILKAHFSNEGIQIEKGMHDQSLFSFDSEFAIKYLNEYREKMGILYNNDETQADRNEMKLLKSFEYLNQVGYEPAKCIEISPNYVLSFNTQEELKEIKKKLQRG